jgi:hypothetical protein
MPVRIVPRQARFIPFFIAAYCLGQEAFPPADSLPAVSAFSDPLVMADGSPVRTREDWFQKRVPELKAQFQYYMYGFPPPAPARDGVRAAVRRTDPAAFGGKATLREVEIRLGPEPSRIMRLLLVTPNRSRRPAPCFVGANFDGNHTLVRDTAVALPAGWMSEKSPGVTDHRATAAGRGTRVDEWSIERTVERGYAVATFYRGDVEPDNPESRDGVRYHVPVDGRTDPGPHDWGTVAAWAWGISRAVDVLVTAPDIDPDRIAVVGFSRLGKAALLCAALDGRIAAVFPHQSGCGGAAPDRSTVGESVQVINGKFPHWFCETFRSFNGAPERLPFDQHELLALLAPRPVLLTAATEDTWGNPAGVFEMARRAGVVYEFLGKQGLKASRMPKTGKLVNSRLGYFIRPGLHSMTPEDWKAILEFADKHLR